MILGLWEIILVTIIGFTTIIIGILVFTQNPKNKINQLFVLFTFSFLLWIGSAFFSEIPQNLKYSLILSRITYLGVLLSATFLFYFSFYFPQKKEINRILRSSIIGIAFLFSVLILFTPLVINDVLPTKWGFNLKFGKFYYFYLIFCILLALSSLYNFWINLRKAKTSSYFN